MVMAVRTQVNLGGLIMRNPVTVASGTFAAGREYADFVDLSRLGAVTTKGVSLDGWPGNDAVRIAETPSGMLNSIGLQNPGVDRLIEGDIAWLATQDVPCIVNVSGHSVSEYQAVIERLETCPQVHAYEINISCPNVDAGGMAFGCVPQKAAEVIRACRNVAKRPMIVKLTPNVTDITEVAKAVQAEGADAISLVNTFLGMAIDAKRRKPVLARVVGGLSGPAIKPIALRMVWQCHQAVSIPLLGMGGIATGIDAVEFMLAGATAVAVGTANFTNPHATMDVVSGIEAYCEEQGISDVNELIGALEC